MQILTRQTSPGHPITAAQIIGELARAGIDAERKAIYADIEALKVFGLDIQNEKSRSHGFFVASRDFDIAELKLLVDAVQSSKFVSFEESLKLIKKLEGLASRHEAAQLARQVYVSGRVKAKSPDIYKSVDVIHSAIGQNRQVAFKYLEYSLDKEQRFRRGGAFYHVSPLALCWMDDNYYMIGYYEQYNDICHFRVDRMAEIKAAPEPREDNLLTREFDVGRYTKTVFSAFSGESVKVSIEFDNSLIGAALDRFGAEIFVSRRSDKSFRITVSVIPAPTFLSWVLQFGEKARITGPPEVVEMMRGLLQKTMAVYDSQSESLGGGDE